MDCQPQVAWAGRQARGCEGSSAQHARHCHQLPGTAQPSVPRGYLLHKQKDLRSPCHRTTEPQTQDGPGRHPEGVPGSTDSRRATSHVGRRPKRNSVPSLGTQPGGSKTLTRSLHSQPWELWVRPLPKRQQHLCGGLFAQPALSGPDSGSPSPRPCLFRSFPLSPNLQLGLSLNPTFEPQKTRGQSGLQAPTHTGPVGAHTPSSSHLHPHWATLHPLGRTCCSKEISGR